jgi:preprotein translocase subunit SecG
MVLLTLLKVLHILVAVFLILVVLLQTGKGAEMGAAFGGSSQTLFGSGGPASFMAKLTTTAAVVFMLTSLSLAYFSSSGRRVADVPAMDQPVQQVPAGIPQPGEIPVTVPETTTPPAETGGAEE